MNIAERILRNQDQKEMTRRAIRILIALHDEEAESLAAEFEATYGEPV